MSVTPTATTSHSRLDSIFASASQAYKKKTGKDITSHHLATELQSCHSIDVILAVLQRHIPTPEQSQSSSEGSPRWLIPTVSVLYAFSATLSEGVGLVFSPAKVIFTGIGILFLAAKDVSASREMLTDLFNRIENFFLHLEIYTGVRPTAAMTDIIVQIMVEVLTILGIATKEVRRGRLRKYLKKLLGDTDVEDSLKRLDKLTQEEALMASAELLKMTDGLGSQVVGVDDRVRGIDTRVQGIGHRLDQANRDQLRDRLLQWLSPPDPSVNHNIACKACHSGTAQWFFQGSIFSQWKSDGAFLWIHGKPGSGKSVFCSSIIQDILAMREAGTASIAYFYFDFRDIDKQKLQNLLPSLLIQLSAQSNSCCDVLSRLYSAHDRGVQKPSDRAMAKCLKEMLTLEAQGPTYIILDALDECPNISGIPSPREEVLDFVNELVGLHLPNLHICATSRPEFDIQAALGSLTPRIVSLHEESGQEADIIEYISSVVHSDRSIRRWRQEDKDMVIRTLSEKANGMFRWVFCQLEVLRHCLPPSVRRILEELPEGLDETYERILKEIRKPNQKHTYRLLQCLLVAVRPLRIAELAEVLAVNFEEEGTPKLNPDWRWTDQEAAIMSACSSLVIIINGEDGSRVAQFSHFSVKEFLVSNRLAESSNDVSQYHIPLEPAHTTLAQACLGVLLLLDDRIDRDSIKHFPLAEYAAEHWVTHAQFEGVSPRISDGMECLFDADKPHFAAWLWIYHGDSFHRRMPTMRPQKPEAVPLYYSALFGFRNLAERLLADHPEHADAKGGYFETPLHAALYHGHAGVSWLLIEKGVDVKSQHRFGHVPLHWASVGGLAEIVQWLLKHGRNVDSRSPDGTPLHLAAYHGRLEASQILLENKADINARDNLGRTPLYNASTAGHLEVVRLLLEHGAKVDLRDASRDETDMTASQLAWGPRRQEIIQLLSDYSAKSAE